MTRLRAGAIGVAMAAVWLAAGCAKEQNGATETAALAEETPAATPAPTATPEGESAEAPTPVPAGEVPVYRCRHVDRGGGEIGFNPDEGIWAGAPWAGAFRLADNSADAFLQTQAKIVWDDKAIYVLFICEDYDIWTTYKWHNSPIFNEEVVEVFLDPEGDGEKYFEFEVSPANVRFTAEITWSGGRMSARTLDPAGLPTQVQVDGTAAEGDYDSEWRAVFEIPFAYLGMSAPKSGAEWRGNLYRIDRTPSGEFLCWSPTHTNPPAFHRPKYFGRLIFER